MDRNVALKVLPQYHSENPNFIKRFTQEARTIARLEHKNIIPVFDFGEEAGIAYIAMRYFDGGTLQDLMAQGPLALFMMVEIMHQICAGLDYAHRQGVVHRDMKPSNIMVDDEGAIYLTDFGLAKILEGSPKLTASGAMLGTPLYMAPEQIIGGTVDGRTDIYSVGVILYEMVTGQPPFQADTPMAVALAHYHEPLPLPQSINPDVPDEVQNVILKVLSKNPDDRFQTANQLAEAFAEVVNKLDPQVADSSAGFVSSQMDHKGIPQTTPAAAGGTPTTSTTTIPEAASPSSPVRLIISGISAVALVVIAVILGVIYIRGQDDQTPSVDVISTSLTMYDDFNDSDYDGGVNTNIWQTIVGDSCLIAQENGNLVVTNKKVGKYSEDCDLYVMHPSGISYENIESIQAKMLFASEHTGGDSGQVIVLTTDFANGDYWIGECGLEMSENELVASFWIARGVTGGSVIEEFSSYAEIEPGVWYTFQMDSDTNTGALSCTIDDELIGSKVLDNLEELRTLTFDRGLVVWRAPNTVSTTKVDDFQLIP
jgi:serine/threonine protein kinase